MNPKLIRWINELNYIPSIKEVSEKIKEIGLTLSPEQTTDLVKYKIRHASISELIEYDGELKTYWENVLELRLLDVFKEYVEEHSSETFSGYLKSLGISHEVYLGKRDSLYRDLAYLAVSIKDHERFAEVITAIPELRDDEIIHLESEHRLRSFAEMLGINSSVNIDTNQEPVQEEISQEDTIIEDSKESNEEKVGSNIETTPLEDLIRVREDGRRLHYSRDEIKIICERIRKEGVLPNDNPISIYDLRKHYSYRFIDDLVETWIENATPYALLKSLNSLGHSKYSKKYYKRLFELFDEHQLMNMSLSRFNEKLHEIVPIQYKYSSIRALYNEYQQYHSSTAYTTRNLIKLYQKLRTKSIRWEYTDEQRRHLFDMAGYLIPTYQLLHLIKMYKDLTIIHPFPEGIDKFLAENGYPCEDIQLLRYKDFIGGDIPDYETVAFVSTNKMDLMHFKKIHGLVDGVYISSDSMYTIAGWEIISSEEVIVEDLDFRFRLIKYSLSSMPTDVKMEDTTHNKRTDTELLTEHVLQNKLMKLPQIHIERAKHNPNEIIMKPKIILKSI